MKNIIFIIGVGRSGTTLIQSMLHSHSKIDLSPETHFVKRYILPEIEKGLYSWDNVDLLKKALLNDKFLKESKKNLAELVDRSVQEKKNKLLTGSVFYNLLDSNKVSYIGDKDPMNAIYLSIIKKVFPEAFIIHIIRDPRDVVLSRIKSNWGKSKSVLWHTSEYKYSITKARKEGDAFFGNKYLEIKYEKLLTSTEFELKRVCNFLNLNFEKNMLNYQMEAKSLLRKDELQWKSNVFDPVDKSKIGKWKENLSINQLEIIESILSDLFDALQYDRSLNIFIIKRKIYALSGWLVELLFKLKFG